MKRIGTALVMALGMSSILWVGCEKDNPDDQGGIVRPEVTIERMAPATGEIPSGYAEIGKEVTVKVKVTSNIEVATISMKVTIGGYSQTVIGDTDLNIFEYTYEIPYVLPTGDTLGVGDVLSFKVTATDKNNNDGTASLDLKLGNKLAIYSKNPQTQESFRIWHKFSQGAGAFDLKNLVPKTVNDADQEKDMEDASQVGAPVTGDIWAGYDDNNGTIINKTKFVKLSGKTLANFVLDAQIRDAYMNASTAPVSKIKVMDGDLYAVKLRGQEEYVLLHIKEVNTTDDSKTSASNKGYVEFEVSSAIY